MPLFRRRIRPEITFVMTRKGRNGRRADEAGEGDPSRAGNPGFLRAAYPCSRPLVLAMVLTARPLEKVCDSTLLIQAHTLAVPFSYHHRLLSLLIIFFNPFPCTSLGLLTTPRPIDHAEDFPILDKNNVCGKTPYFAQNRLRESAAMPRKART